MIIVIRERYFLLCRSYFCFKAAFCNKLCRTCSRTVAYCELGGIFRQTYFVRISRCSRTCITCIFERYAFCTCGRIGTYLIIACIEEIDIRIGERTVHHDIDKVICISIAGSHGSRTAVLFAYHAISVFGLEWSSNRRTTTTGHHSTVGKPTTSNIVTHIVT